MRIISGSHKGKRIQAPKQLSARPTTDMAKEALFNILRNQIYFDNVQVLDLFAGTGNISYEFASRGTAGITAVDRDPKSAAFIARTAKELNFPIKVIKSDVFGFLKKTSSKFDVIFADPPYHIDNEDFIKLIELVFERNLLTEEGMLIVEHSKHTDLSSAINFKESRKYGGSRFSFFHL